MRHYRLYLADIIEAMKAIERFVQDIDFEEFREDDRTSSAVIRKFEIIGEAAKGVPEDIRQKYPQIPWREMAGMRDKLIHSYFSINYDLVWETINRRIPTIYPVILGILGESKRNAKS